MNSKTSPYDEEASLNAKSAISTRNMTSASTTTPIPSDFDHAKILMKLTFSKDRKKPALWALRFVAMPVLLMLYTIGFFMGYQPSDGNSYVSGNYRLFNAEEWQFPKSLTVAAFDAEMVDQLKAFFANSTNETVFSSLRVEISNATSPDQLVEECRGAIADAAAEELCAFVRSANSYDLYFGGKETAAPFQSALAGAQYAINAALLDFSNTTIAHPVGRIQRVPELLTKDNVEANLPSLLVPACMYTLAAIVCSQFIIGPVSYEKINGVAKSYLLVGVKMRTYLLQWLVYYSFNGILLAFLLTMVCIFFNLMPLSNAGLIFISNYLGLVHMFAMFILLMQFVNQEELASMISWMVGLLSICIGVVVTIIMSVDFTLLTLLSVFSPFIGMIQYFGIYITYDVTGFNTGIHPGEDVAESGLLGNMIAQVCGILFWIAIILAYSSARLRNWFSAPSGTHIKTTHSSNDFDEEGGMDVSSNASDNFEPLTPGKDVVLSLRDVSHTYNPSKLNCDSGAKPVEVLKGLSMDICRGEVFGYLGHNGAGKSTSVEILSTELMLQEGHATYHFKDGDANLGNSLGERIIRHKIGVCPQHNDSLQATLTCRETLTLFARLKGGISMEEGRTIDEAIEHEVDRRLADVKFTSEEDIDKPVGTFSGGMKRKVLIAVALLGDPEVVFLDEPTAGLDPYNRRIIWDMIISAKKGRSIVLTTHFLDEADVLSDRIGIIKNGKLITCGSSLFLKHHFGAGYTLKFESRERFDVCSFVHDAEMISEGKHGEYQWRLNFGAESKIPRLLSTLSHIQATNVSLELTTLEEVFLETGKEDPEDNNDEEADRDYEEVDEGVDESDTEDSCQKEEHQARIWQPRAKLAPLSGFKKFRLVMHFAMTNALKIKGTIFLNIALPMTYMVIGLVTVSFVKQPISGEIIRNDPIPVSSPWTRASFFGVETLETNPIYPLEPFPEPRVLGDYFERSLPVMGGYYAGNETLQYAPDLDLFALQFGTSVLANYNVFLDDASSIQGGIATNVQQLPYVADAPFRIDLLIVPLVLSFGFAGLAFVVLDILLLKGNNIIGLFRVGGITEWSTYLGVSAYKLVTTFLPFFIVVVILGLSLKNVIFGNAGRWLGTVLIMFSYGYSATPMGLIFSKRTIHSDFKAVASWFPGVYFTLVGLPYIAWASALQAVPEAENIIVIIGDIFCVVPQFAFQRGLGGVIQISSVFNDANLTWGDVWSFEPRIWFTILIMLLVGSLEWLYLYGLTTGRERNIALSSQEAKELKTPVDVSQNPDMNEERERSLTDDEGINARDLVKLFVVEKKSRFALMRKKKRQKVIKQAVKGVSWGIRKNEIYALLGPNGAGKSTAMNMLAGQLTPEFGDVALDGAIATADDRSVDHLYRRCNVAFCPQFDALFPKKTVEEHIQFYAQIRGLDLDERAAQEHIDAIVKLLGLEKHRYKESTQLSGGYKRRLCMAVAMIGYPRVMMIDECTTGLDPSARRLIWDVLKPETKNGYDVPAILLSSHYMDECQNLGTRIGIMIDGGIVATGTLDRLQQLYCTGLFVEISLQPFVKDCSEAESRVILSFSELNMEANIYESLPYHFKLKVTFQDGVEVSNNITQLAEAFELLEAKKEELGIQFYSVALMNLEQIFIDLSRRQFEADDLFDNEGGNFS